MTIGEATKYCEAEVPKYCATKTCPQYCNSLSSSTSQTSCLADCLPEKKCRIKPTVGNDKADNLVLDAQNREQLWACIGENRDPASATVPWQQVQTPSFSKAIGQAQ